ncbi:hypothetical protein CPB86DRAFT_784419 [Serendipita vermifera]|nr:hypothetical protein CPB86DRAFT_784419 [Serendipita vermifera]
MKFTTLATLLVASASAVLAAPAPPTIYCGGLWGGGTPAKCPIDYSCYYLNRYYSVCVPDNTYTITSITRITETITSTVTRVTQTSDSTVTRVTDTPTDTVTRTTASPTETITRATGSSSTVTRTSGYASETVPRVTDSSSEAVTRSSY